MASRTEEVVLRISMVADDEATKKVQALNQELSKLGEPVRRSTTETSKHIEEFQKALGNLSREAVGAGRELLALGRVAGPVGVGIAAIGAAIYKSVEAAKAWSQQVIQIGNAARMSGMTPGTFRDLARQFSSMTGSIQSGMQTIGTFNRAMAELTTANSPRRDALLRMSGAYRDQMANAIIDLSSTSERWQAFNKARHYGESIYQNALDQGYSKDIARQKELMFFEAIGAAQLINVTRDFTKADDDRSRNQDKADEKAHEINDALSHERDLREEIFNKTLGWTRDLDLAFINIITKAEQAIIDLGEAEKKSPKGTLGWGDIPQLPPGGRLRMPWDFLHKGGAQHIGGQSPVFFPEGSLGQGDITKGWRHSPNFEDARDAADKQLDDASRHSTVVDTNTKEFHQLNQNIEQLIDTGVFGPPVAMAEGGVVSGPVNALVGEAGPEAIMSKSGTSIVSRPTRMMLGTDGAQAVVPLSSAGADIDKTIAGFANQEKYIAGRSYAADLIQSLDGYQKANPQQKALLRQYMQRGGEGMNAIDEAWCAHTVRASFAQAGLGGALGGTSALASSFNTWQRGIDPTQAQRGDVVTLPAIKGVRSGHVGIATGPYDPKAGTIPFESGNFDTSQFPGGHVVQHDLPVGGSGANRVLSVRRAEPAISLHAPTRMAAMAEGGIVVPGEPLGHTAAQAARYLRSYMEQGGRTAVSSVSSAASDLRTQAQATYANPTWLGAGKTALAGAGLIGSATPASMAWQAALSPGLERAGFSPETAGNITNVSQALINPFHASALIRSYQGAKAGAKIGGSVLEAGGGATRPMFSGDPDDDRAAIDGTGGRGGTTEGTITIEHQETGQRGERRTPLFRAPHIARQSQMEPASVGPDNHWSNSQEMVQ